MMKPGWQLHLYDPLVFSQMVLLPQGSGSILHSFMSEITNQKRKRFKHYLKYIVHVPLEYLELLKTGSLYNEIPVI